MRKFLLLIGVALMVGLGLSSMRSDSGPKIEFTTMSHNFGTFKEGDIVNCKFPFKNTGTAPLIITDIERPCGCLLPVWPKNPIMPGDTASIRVYFNSKDRPGEFRKTMVVYTNMASKDQVIIMVKGNADKHFKPVKYTPAD